MRKLLVASVSFIVVAAGAQFAGPLSSGALFLLVPVGDAPTDHGNLLLSREPRHKGGVHLGTGLYTREDEDLIVPGTPALVLRRTYLSGYRVSREFGVGTTHNGELYLVGDPEQFQWLALIFPDGSRIRFDRTSSGTSYYNAMFEHHTSPTEWRGARLGWVGTGWALRRADGTIMRFQSCGSTGRFCSILEERDADGHTIRYRRDRSGQLSRMEAAPDRWIAFTYDTRKRVVRAYDSSGNEVRYEYDGVGRLSHVKTSNGTERRYGYTEQDQMSTIADPGIRIENTYDSNGRGIRQVNFIDGSGEPYTFDFAYVLKDGAVVQSDTTTSDGTWTRYTYAPSGYIESESWARVGEEPITFTYQRAAVSSVITLLTVTCPDETGRPIRQSSPVGNGNEEWIKWALFVANCFGGANRDYLPNGWPQAVGV
jgi:YD repeat-containing protein